MEDFKEKMDKAGANITLNQDFYLSDIVAFELEGTLPWSLVKRYVQ